MRGSLRKRSKNGWTIIVDIERDATGKRRQKWITCHENKRDAERRLAEIITEINSQLYLTPREESLGAYLERWGNDHSSMRVRATTLDGYRWRVESINSVLGHIKLAELRPEHLQKYYSTRLAEGKAPGTIIKHHHLLRQVLGTAVKRKLTSHNLGELVDPPKKSYKEMMALNEKEVLHVLGTCADTELDRIVAIKVIDQPVSDEPAYGEALRREARLSSSLDHPNVVTVYDFQIEDGRAYIVMEQRRALLIHC